MLIIPQQTNIFGVYWDKPSVRSSVHLSMCLSLCLSIYLCVYKIPVLVILYRELLLHFCFSCIEILIIHWSYIEVLQDAILKCHLLLLEELSPLERRLFFFLAHLSTKCSEWANVITHSSVRRPFTFPCLHSSIYKYEPISIKLGPYVYDH